MLALTACNSGGGSTLLGNNASDGSSETPADPQNPGDSGVSDGSEQTKGRNITINPGPDATTQALRAFIDARPGDVIEFGCGFFSINKTLQISHTEDVLVKGCGMNKTVLSFVGNDAPEGILVVNAQGITIQGLTVADTHGDGITLRNVDHGTLDHVRAFWSSGGGASSPKPISKDDYQDRIIVECTQPAVRDPDVPENALLGGTTSPDYTVSKKSGRYGIYPVKSSNILVTHSEAIGASDAGIYIGQSDNSKIVYSRAAYNVFGLEIENMRHGEYAHNIAECNTGGFLIYDLDNLTRYGHRTSMHDNISRMNNSYNFSKGGLVSNVPPGSGMVTLSYDGIDVFNNVFEDNNTAGIIHTSYEIFPEGDRPNDKKLDWYSEGLHIWGNTFRNNGNALPLPTTTDVATSNLVHLLPLIIGVKVAGACLTDPGKLLTECISGGQLLLRGADIIWDGYMDEYDSECPYPTDAQGNPIPKDTPYYPEKPRFSGVDPQPSCHYNGYKFNIDANGVAQRKLPKFMSSCIAHDNTFGSKSVHFANIHGTEGLEALLTVLGDDPIGDLTNPVVLTDILTKLPNLAADLNMYPTHDCQARFGKVPPKIDPVVIEPFVPSGDYVPAPTTEETAKLCNAEVPAGSVNFEALLKADCPRLDQYHLFADEGEPASMANGPRSFPYVLNTKLFSDYAVKYRVIYLPPGTSMTYNAPGKDKPVGALIFPLGTAIAKTFSFEKNGVVTPIETRLLIKRENSNGETRWKGLPYVWHTDENGKRHAELTVEGATKSVSWNFQDVNTGKQISGSTEDYAVPNANQCLSCHSNNDRPGGSAPIGPKVRNLNRPYQSEVMGDTSGQARAPIFGHNQIVWLCEQGWLTNCPSDMGLDPATQIATGLPRLPIFDVPGDSGFPAGSDKDIEARARAWLEVNCAHCHNPQGFANNTGLFLNHYRPVDGHYGVCKRPAAAGAEGTGGRTVVIKPGSADQSVLAFRIGPEATNPAARMPPIARSVVDTDAAELVDTWINTVVDASYPGAAACTGN